MNGNTSDRAKVEEHIWGHGKSVSGLSSSENNMSDERKKIIHQALHNLTLQTFELLPDIKGTCWLRSL